LVRSLKVRPNVKWELTHSFSLFPLVRDINTHRHYAIKRERRKENGGSQLKHENVMYDVLAGGGK
jgi:hypothetical protein